MDAAYRKPPFLIRLRRTARRMGFLALLVAVALVAFKYWGYSKLDDEIRAGVGRVDAEEAAWLVAIDGSEKVGMVFGELAGGEVNVRIWIHPNYRKRGYGTAALRKSRSEMAAYFPAVPLVVRAPAAGA